ncbi:unnamed protein product, partial [Pneumocystis jirovecii]
MTNKKSTSKQSKSRSTPVSKKKKATVSIDDLSLPRTAVLKLVKKVIPEHTNIQKDAVTALMRGSSVFISYLSSTAFELSKVSSRKVILPSDVIKAMENIEFDSFIPRMIEELKCNTCLYLLYTNEYLVHEVIVKEKKNAMKSDKDSPTCIEVKDEHISKKMKTEDGAETVEADINHDYEYYDDTCDDEGSEYKGEE